MEEIENRSLLHLPRDLIHEILSLLSVRTLIMLKCLSKSLCSLISDEGFVRAHLLKSSKDSSFTHHKIAPVDVCKPRGRFDSCAITRSFKYADFTRARRRCTSTRLLDEKLAEGFDFSGAKIIRVGTWFTKAGFGNIVRSSNGLLIKVGFGNIVRSSNGLLCYFSGKGFTLRNPSTRRYKNLPPPFCCFDKDDGKSVVISCGFGYVESTNDYKVVALSRPQKVDGEKLCTVKIYSLKTDSWRTVCDGYKFKKPIMDTMARHVCGMLYWLRILRWKKGKALQWEIVSFDLEKEEFGITLTPPHALLKGNMFYAPQLGVFNGYLCILCLCNTTADLLIFKPPFWTKIAIFPNARVIGGSDWFSVCTDGVIFRDFEPESTLFYYMPKEMCKRSLRITDLDIFNGVCAHVESLVSLGNNSLSEEDEKAYYGGVIDLETENTSLEDYDEDGEGSKD